MKRILALGAVLLWSTIAIAQERAITVASTTSTEQSGLFGYLLPLFSKAGGIDVKVVAVGTGQALDIGCLLYTSPSPRYGLLSRMPSSA